MMTEIMIFGRRTADSAAASLNSIRKALRQKNKIFLICFSLIIFLSTCNGVTFAETKVYCLDSSGSMKIGGRIEVAKEAVIKEIERAKTGDRLSVLTFDTYARLLGKLEISERPGFEEAKQEMIKKILEVKADGMWTHLEQAVMKAKAILLDEREFVGAKILIFSDGISDPDPRSGVPPVNLEEMANLVSKDLGINIYIISFAEDIAGFFGTQIQNSGIVAKPSVPHIKGVPITSFSTEELETAVEGIKKADSKEVQAPQRKITEQSKKKELPKIKEEVNSKILYAVLFGFGILAIFALFAIFTRKKREISHFTLETEIGDERKEIEVDLSEGKKKSVGTSGDIPMPTLDDLPPILFSLQRKKGKTLIIPQDTISLNGLLLTGVSPVNPGDIIGVRDKLIFRISDRRNESE